MATYSIGDIHGCFNTFKLLLNKINFSADDLLIVHGDFIDRGDHSKEVIDLLMELEEKNQAIVILGNHELMMLNYHLEGDLDWFETFGKRTLKSFNEKTYLPKYYVDWIKNLPIIYEHEKFYCVHGGLNIDKKIEDQTPYEVCNMRGTFLTKNNNFDKPIVFGHTPIVEGKFLPNNIIPIDTGCVYRKENTLTAFNLDTEEFISVLNAEEIINPNNKFFNIIVGIQNSIVRKKVYGDQNIGWWRDNDTIKLYHGTSKTYLDSIMKNGLIGNNFRFVYTTLDINTAYGYSLYGESKGRFLSRKTYKTTTVPNRVVVEISMPLDYFDSEMLNINFTDLNTYNKLTDRSVYDEYDLTDSDYYMFTELVLSRTVEPKYITNVYGIDDVV